MTSSPFNISAVEASIAAHLSNLPGPTHELKKIFELRSTIKDDVQIAQSGLDVSTRYDFQPKALFLTTASTHVQAMGIVEYSPKPVSLKDVGIMQAYSRLGRPEFSLIICQKGISKELSYLLADPATNERLTRFDKLKRIEFVDLI